MPPKKLAAKGNRKRTAKRYHMIKKKPDVTYHGIPSNNFGDS